ncbi:hypothetical protein JKF63_02992 [Porcisia hertigi]|uniref:RNA-editing substrate-binding complex 7 protein domain-containing protein n=1 Tax=Porcisia hertigi TaxID=2761500 RepID=A0A836HT79_9TRYP|nr:hypothetical protein JKF63_02992 [Porcisia hertigi]
MLAGRVIRPVCTAYRVLREPRLTGCSSLRTLVSLTRVRQTLKNTRTGVTIEPPGAQRTGGTDKLPLHTPGARETISIGQRLYSLTRCYMQKRNSPTCDDTERNRLSTEAWHILQSITEEDLEALPIRDVAEIVVAYNYFGGIWANGLHGPAKAIREGKQTGPVSSSSECSGDDAPPDYPIIERPDVVSGDRETISNTAAASSQIMREVPVKRASPLDDFLEF